MKTKVLMVCLGNICRSPMAEGLLRSKVDPQKIEVDSAGTSDYHLGQNPDKRMIATAKNHQIDISSLSGRQFTSEDFDRFDHIFAMDQSNYENILKLIRSEKDKEKVELILNRLYPGEDMSVPDPYFGGDRGFEEVFQLLNKAIDIIVKDLS